MPRSDPQLVQKRLLMSLRAPQRGQVEFIEMYGRGSLPRGKEQCRLLSPFVLLLMGSDCLVERGQGRGIVIAVPLSCPHLNYASVPGYAVGTQETCACNAVKNCCNAFILPGAEKTMFVWFLAPEQTWLGVCVGTGVGVPALGVLLAAGVLVVVDVH